MTRDEIVAIVRSEVAAALGIKDKPRRYAHPCGRDNSAPQCYGSAVHGPEACTCPGVRVEFYPMRFT